MAKLSKRTVDKAEPGAKDYFIWDDELLGFGLRVFASGRRSYLVQYRAKGRTRRFTIGAHGVWTPETARVHAQGTVTSRYIHTVDTALIMAADTVAGYIQGLLDGVTFKRTRYALDRSARRLAMEQLFAEAMQSAAPKLDRLAA